LCAVLYFFRAKFMHLIKYTNSVGSYKFHDNEQVANNYGTSMSISIFETLNFL